MPLVSLAGGSINLATTGTGRTQVVFVHGLGPGAIAWTSVIDELPETFRTFAIDLPGFGESDRRGFNGEIDSAATVLHQTLHAFGRSEPVTIVGHDYGALVALSFSARFPSHVGRLALVSSGAFVRDVRGLGARHDEIAVRGWGPEQADSWLRSGLVVSPPEEKYALLRDAAAEVDAEIIAGCMASMMTAQYLAEAQRISKPILLIRGEADPLVTRDDVEVVAARAANATVETMAGVGHWPHIEAAPKFRAALMGFLAG